MSRIPWGSPLHIQGDWVEGDICMTPSCRREPKDGAKHCDPCRERLEAEGMEAKHADNIDRLIDEDKESQ
jgi:hypothetical protein